MPKTVLKGCIIIPPDNRAAVLQALEEHIALTRAESGCLVFEITPDKEEDGKYHVYEEFADRAAFEQHQARVKASHWGRVSADVARHYEPLTEIE